MDQKSQSEYFIRVLAQTLEADRQVKNACLSFRAKAKAQVLRQLYQSDLDLEMPMMEPLDCVRLMADKPRAHQNA